MQERVVPRPGGGSCARGFRKLARLLRFLYSKKVRRSPANPINRKGTRKKGGLRMNWERVAGNWKEFRGKVLEKWGFLTDDELDVIAGKRDMLIGKLEEHYGLTKDRAARVVEDFLEELDKGMGHLDLA